MIKRNIASATEISKKINNSHLLTNMEYGAIILLSNSSYGKTGNSMYSSNNLHSFERIYVNAYIYNLTGCSSEYSKSSKSFLDKESKECVEYNDLTNVSHIANSVNYPIGYRGAGASSTGTIYGVYDLANIDGELTSSYVVGENGIENVSTVYQDIYSYSDYIGIVSSSNNIYNLYRYKLGDGIREHFRTLGTNGMWHNGMLFQNKDKGIIIRGGNGTVKNASVYTASIEDTNYVAPFRLVLVTK